MLPVTETTTRARRGRPSSFVLRRLRIRHVAFGAAAVVRLILPGRLSALPATVDAVSVENPTLHELRIKVSNTASDGSVATGAARRDATRFRTLIGQGAVWVSRFRAHGQGGGELRIDRTQLLRHAWLIDVPDHLVRRLEASAPPPP